MDKKILDDLNGSFESFKKYSLKESILTEKDKRNKPYYRKNYVKNIRILRKKSFSKLKMALIKLD